MPTASSTAVIREPRIRRRRSVKAGAAMEPFRDYANAAFAALDHSSRRCSSNFVTGVSLLQPGAQTSYCEPAVADAGGAAHVRAFQPASSPSRPGSCLASARYPEVAARWHSAAGQSVAASDLQTQWVVTVRSEWPSPGCSQQLPPKRDWHNRRRCFSPYTKIYKITK